MVVDASHDLVVATNPGIDLGLATDHRLDELQGCLVGLLLVSQGTNLRHNIDAHNVEPQERAPPMDKMIWRYHITLFRDHSNSTDDVIDCQVTQCRSRCNVSRLRQSTSVRLLQDTFEQTQQ